MTERDYRTWEQVAKDYEAALREIARLIDLMPSLSDEGRSRLHSVIRPALRTEGRDDG